MSDEVRWTTGQTDDEYLRTLRAWADNAEDDLRRAVATRCPAGSDQHSPVQHRDRKPPWCPSCGRDARGVARKDAATEAPA